MKKIFRTKLFILTIFVFLVVFSLSSAVNIASASGPSLISMAQTSDYLFAANYSNGNVYVFKNTGDHNLVKTLAVGNRPSHMINYYDYENSKDLILIALSSAKKIKVLNADTLEFEADINTPKMPYYMALDTDKIFVTVSRNNGSSYQPFIVWMSNSNYTMEKALSRTGVRATLFQAMTT